MPTIGRTGSVKQGGKQMFDDAQRQIESKLRAEKKPVTVAEMKAALDGGELMAESAINQSCETESIGGEEYVLSVEDGPSFTAEDLNGEAPENDESASDDDAGEEVQSQPPEDTPDESAESRPSRAAEPSVAAYELNGIRITVDPAELAVGEPTGEDHYGLPKLTNGSDLIPNETTPYFPIEVGGGRDSEEVICRVLGHMHKPLLLEGEAGTGKNRAIERVTSATNRPVQRINFGSDVSVYDLVGEKDVVEGTTYYILGKLAKAVIFGHTAIFDEVNMAQGDVTSFLHAVTEEVGSRQLELRGTDVTVRDLPVSEDEVDEHGSVLDAQRAKWNPDEHLGEYIHPEFRATATCNPLDYADTNPMNDAFRDRFEVIRIPYLPPDVEADLLAEEMDLSDPTDEMVRLTRLAQTLREAREEANALSCPITHRSLYKTMKLAGAQGDFMSVREAAEITLAGHASSKQDKQFIRDSIADEL